MWFWRAFSHGWIAPKIEALSWACCCNKWISSRSPLGTCLNLAALLHPLARMQPQTPPTHPYTPHPAKLCARVGEPWPSGRPGAQEEAHRAFRRKAAEAHPDQGGTRAKCDPIVDGSDLQREVAEAVKAHRKRSASETQQDAFQPKRRCLSHWSSDLGASFGDSGRKVCSTPLYRMRWHNGAIYGTGAAKDNILCWKPGETEPRPVAGEGAAVNGVNDFGDCEFDLMPKRFWQLKKPQIGWLVFKMDLEVCYIAMRQGLRACTAHQMESFIFWTTMDKKCRRWLIRTFNLWSTAGIFLQSCSSKHVRCLWQRKRCSTSLSRPNGAFCASVQASRNRWWQRSRLRCQEFSASSWLKMAKSMCPIGAKRKSLLSIQMIQHSFKSLRARSLSGLYQSLFRTDRSMWACPIRGPVGKMKMLVFLNTYCLQSFSWSAEGQDSLFKSCEFRKGRKSYRMLHTTHVVQHGTWNWVFRKCWDFVGFCVEAKDGRLPRRAPPWCKPITLMLEPQSGGWILPRRRYRDTTGCLVGSTNNSNCSWNPGVFAGYVLESFFSRSWINKNNNNIHPSHIRLNNFISGGGPCHSEHVPSQACGRPSSRVHLCLWPAGHVAAGPDHEVDRCHGQLPQEGRQLAGLGESGVLRMSRLSRCGQTNKLWRLGTRQIKQPNISREKLCRTNSSKTTISQGRGGGARRRSPSPRSMTLGWIVFWIQRVQIWDALKPAETLEFQHVLALWKCDLMLFLHVLAACCELWIYKHGWKAYCKTSKPRRGAPTVPSQVHQTSRQSGSDHFEV